VLSGVLRIHTAATYTRYHPGGGETICPRRWQFDGGISFRRQSKIAVDLRPSADGSAVSPLISGGRCHEAYPPPPIVAGGAEESLRPADDVTLRNPPPHAKSLPALRNKSADRLKIAHASVLIYIMLQNHFYNQSTCNTGLYVMSSLETAL